MKKNVLYSDWFCQLKKKNSKERESMRQYVQQKERINKIAQIILRPSEIQFQKEIAYLNEIGKATRRIISSKASQEKFARWEETEKVVRWLIQSRTYGKTEAGLN